MTYIILPWQLDEANHKINNQQENLFDMKEQLAHNQAELRLKTATFEGKGIISMG